MLKPTQMRTTAARTHSRHRTALRAVLTIAALSACGGDHTHGALGHDAQTAPGPDGSRPGLDGGGSSFDATVTPDASQSDAAQPDAAVVMAKRAPNIVFVLVDDFSMNLVDAMPQLKRLMADGLTFSNYFVSDSLCCPSRTSMFTGKFPHNSGVFTNSGDDGGYATFNRLGNDKATFATALQAVGYTTAMLGKYLNGYEPMTNGPQTGWTHWNVAGNGYPEFNYDLNQDGMVTHYGMMDQDYLTEVIAGLGTDIIKAAASGPFVIEFATFAPHAPYTPAPQDANLFPDSKLPRTPAFGARPDANAPAWLQQVPQLKQAEIDNLETIYRKRMQAVQAVDRMIAGLRGTLDQLGLSDDTYLVFTSDNGYHLGDFSLRAGKQTAYDTDIHVPLIVVGPGVPKGKTIDAIVQNVDLCPTFRELSAAGDASTINGRSLVPFLRGKEPTDWRTAALVEHHGVNDDPTDPDGQDKFSADPPTYSALRLASELYVEYDDGSVEYHDLGADAYELKNTQAMMPAKRKTELHDALTAITSCKTASDCWSAQHVSAP